MTYEFAKEPMRKAVNRKIVMSIFRELEKQNTPNNGWTVINADVISIESIAKIIASKIKINTI